ncbi:hypothetical protein GCM10010446_55520 [Streptomyces enissocaesilis]|uniref:Uncharacterized protein n=1 Tax=Streptomyces enissocaesilis TaxID=332589 RepID=A0ABN3XK56_9ACTN
MSGVSPAAASSALQSSTSAFAPGSASRIAVNHSPHTASSRASSPGLPIPMSLPPARGRPAPYSGAGAASSSI